WSPALRGRAATPPALLCSSTVLAPSGWSSSRRISPGVKRVAVLREPTVAGIGQLAAMQTAAPSFGVELQPIDARDVGEFERVLADFAGAPNGGLIVPLSTSAETHRTRIIALANRYRLPAVYPSRVDAALGGLISYGPDTVDQYRRAAGYVDRILKGEKPADLPVQAPTKFELAINLKTAKTRQIPTRHRWGQAGSAALRTSPGLSFSN